MPGIGDFKSSHISSMPRPQDSTERHLSEITDSQLYNLSRAHGTAARRIRSEYTADIQYINGIHGYIVYLYVRNRAHSSKYVRGVCKAVIVTLFKTRFLAILVT